MRNTLRLPAIILVLALVLLAPCAIVASSTDAGSAIQRNLDTAIALIEESLEPGQEIVALDLSGEGEVWYATCDATTGELLTGTLPAATGSPYVAYSPKGNPPGGKGNPGGPNPNGGNPGGGNPPGGKGNPGGPNPNGGNPGGGNPPGGNPGN